MQGLVLGLLLGFALARDELRSDKNKIVEVEG